MNRTSHFRGEERKNEALPLDSAFSGEFTADDGDSEVALSALPRPGVTGVEVRFVDDFNSLGGQARFELDLDGVSYRSEGHFGRSIASSFGWQGWPRSARIHRRNVEPPLWCLSMHRALSAVSLNPILSLP